MTPTAVVFFILISIAFTKLSTFRSWKVTCPQWYYEGRTSENPIGLRLLDYLLFKKYSTTEIIQVSKRINITVLYEALSNNSVYFIKEHLAPVYKYLHQGINLELIPYGRTTEDISEYRYEFTCPNGELECIANKIHACAMYYLAKRKKHTRLVEIISCLMGHPNHKKALSTCCSKSGVQSQRIRKCAFRLDGSLLLADKGEKTRQWISSITEFPAVIVDGVFDEAKNAMALNDLWSFVCTEVPEVCRPKPPPTTRYVRTTTKAVKIKKGDIKKVKKTLLDKYNKSLDYAMQLAEQFWDFKYQKMAALGCTTTPRPTKKTTTPPHNTTPSVYEYAEIAQKRDDSETSKSDDDVSKRVSKSVSKSDVDVSKSEHDVPKHRHRVPKPRHDSSESDEDVPERKSDDLKGDDYQYSKGFYDVGKRDRHYKRGNKNVQESNEHISVGEYD